jgi:hypothetical protein
VSLAEPPAATPASDPASAQLPPLHAAAAVGDMATLRTLLGGDMPLESSVDVLARDGDGWTALHHAAGANQADVIRLLVKTTEKKGVMQGGSIFDAPSTPLHVRLLEARDHEGRTALHLAAVQRVAALNALVECGADVNATCNDGVTPLHLTVLAQEDFAIQALLRAGADPSLRDRQGVTPIDLSEGSPLQPILQAAAKKAKPPRDTLAVQKCWNEFLTAVRDGQDEAMKATLTPERCKQLPESFPRWVEFTVKEISVSGLTATATAAVRYGADSLVGDVTFILEGRFKRTDTAWAIDDVRRVPDVTTIRGGAAPTGGTP